MRLEDLDELHAWMCEKRVLHVSAEGITLTLDASALPQPVFVAPEGAKTTWGDDDEGEQETPQERVRRLAAAGKFPGDEEEGDDAS